MSYSEAYDFVQNRYYQCDHCAYSTPIQAVADRHDESHQAITIQQTRASPLVDASGAPIQVTEEQTIIMGETNPDINNEESNGDE